MNHSTKTIRHHLHHAHPPLPPHQIFKKRGGEGGGLTGFQFLEGAAEKEGWLFYGEDCSFYIKNKLKSKIFNDKKVYIGVHRKSDFYEKWGVHKKPIYRGELPKKGGGFVQFDDLRGAWRKRSGWCFLMHTMIYMTVLARSGNFYNKTNVY